MTDTETETEAPRPYQHPPFMVERVAATIASVSTPLSLADMPAGVRTVVEALARDVLDAIRGDEADWPEPPLERALTPDEVDRITHSYDRTGILFKDIYRLADSHRLIHNALLEEYKDTEADRSTGGRYLGELLWLVAHLADRVSPEVLLPPRLAGHVAGARAIYDPGRYTVGVPVASTAPDSE